MPTKEGTAIALTIAGSDSSGGAGIQADLKAFSALGVYGSSVITAITAQNTKCVSAVHLVPVEIIEAQIQAVLEDLDVLAIKVGMLANANIINCVASRLKQCGIPIVLDPVMVAKSGDALLQDEAIEALKSQLIPLATLVTPNLPEAAKILNAEYAEDEEKITEYGKQILQLGCQAVLMKGGHASGDQCTDILIHNTGQTRCFSSKRILTQNTHGTGCTLSASIAAGLAKDLSLDASVAQAHSYLHRAIEHADTLDIGEGHGPVHHFHQFW